MNVGSQLSALRLADQRLQVAINVLRKALDGSGSGGGVWGAITGTLSAQTDLQEVLDGKASTAALPVAGQVSVTVPALAYHHEQTVTATGVTGSMKVLVSLAPHADTDENHETLLEVDALAAEPSANALKLRMAFTTPTCGPIRINYMAV